MTTLRLLLGPGAPRTLDTRALRDLLAWPAGGAVRGNSVMTLDGSAVGADGTSGSINTPADNIVYAALRDLADVVVVGAGTARAEGYERVPLRVGGRQPAALVVVSRSGKVPGHLVGAGGGRARGILATCAASGRRESADVWLCGTTDVDLAVLRRRLEDAGMPRILAEGGPSLLAQWMAAGELDEMAVTIVPRFVGGDGTRLAQGPAVDLSAQPRHLVEGDGTLLALHTLRTSPTLSVR